MIIDVAASLYWYKKYKDFLWKPLSYSSVVSSDSTIFMMEAHANSQKDFGIFMTIMKNMVETDIHNIFSPIGVQNATKNS